VLCPGAIFSLGNTVRFTAANQQIYTRGLPTDTTRAVLRIGNSGLSLAIGGYFSGVSIKNIVVDGNVGTFGPQSGGSALIEIGAAPNVTVENIVAENTRGWSSLHIIEGAVTNNIPQCQNATISNNTIMNAGTPFPAGPWADGISLSCGNTKVTNNTVTDATDGAIVVFGAPGSLIENNTVIAATKNLLGGINMVDYAPVNGNYNGTVVTNNTIDAKGALIHVAIGMGPSIWGCPTPTINQGGTVTNNVLTGTHMGYGYAVNGVSNWTVTGNTDLSTHVGTPHPGCGGTVSAPTGFQVEAGGATSSTLQSQFMPALLHYILGITDP
jgi:parallel beta-helix repeat protein